MLREKRLALKLSQAELGRYAVDPIAANIVCLMESGARNIGSGMAARLREAFARAEEAAKAKSNAA